MVEDVSSVAASKDQKGSPLIDLHLAGQPVVTAAEVLL